MSSADVTANNANQPEIVLRDLQSLLRTTLGEQLQVVNYKTTLLLPKGENYASTMLKVDAIIKKSKTSQEEELPLVAKMIPSTEFQRSVMNVTASFKKEIFVLEKLLQAYKQMEEEAGIEPDKQINLVPKFYGGRVSLNDGEEADENATLLMENLQARGYFTMNRLKGLDFNCAKLALCELARFHALGVAVKQKKPDFFAEAKKSVDVFPFVLKDDEFEDVVHHMAKAVCADPRIAKYEDQIKKSMENNNWKALMTTTAVEPWVTIMHGDFWVNNMMFRKENGKIGDIKFIDFQLTRISSPLLDLPYFLCCSTSVEVIDNHFDELIDIYYNSFIKMLKRLDCDASPFTRDSFDKQLTKDGTDELFHCLMAMKFFTLEATDDLDLNDMKGSVMMSSGSNLYFERSWKVVSKFVEKGWL